MSRINLNIVATGNFAQVNTQLEQMRNTVAQINAKSAGMGFSSRDLESINRAVSGYDSLLHSTGAFSRQMVNIQDQTTRFGRDLDAGRLKLGQYFAVWSKGNSEARSNIKQLAAQQLALEQSVVRTDTSKIGKAYVDIPRVMQEAGRGTALARKEQQLYNLALYKGGDALINWGKNTQWAGRQLMVGLTLPLAMFGQKAANSFKEFDQQMTRMIKVYGDGINSATNDQLETIRSQVTSLAKDIAQKWGISMKETAEMASELAATGLTGVKLLKATEEATRLATLGELDRQESIKATIALQTTFGLNSKELTESINFLNATENATSTSLQDLVEAIPRAGTVVKQLGGDYKELTVMMVAMREAGVSSGEAANAIKSTLAGLINPTRKTREEFQKFGIDLSNIRDSVGGDPVKMFASLGNELNKLDKITKARLIETLFGKYQFARVSSLIENLGKQGSQTQKVFELMGVSAQKLASSSQQELDRMMNSPSKRFERALESFQAKLLPIGEKFLTMMTTVIDGFGKVFDFLEKHPGLQNFLTNIAGLVALVGPVIMFTGVMGNFLGYLVKGFARIKDFKNGFKGFGEIITAESVAAAKAGDLFQTSLVTQSDAADILTKSLERLNLELAQYRGQAGGAAGGPPIVPPPPPPAGTGGGGGGKRPSGPSGPVILGPQPQPAQLILPGAAAPSGPLIIPGQQVSAPPKIVIASPNVMSRTIPNGPVRTDMTSQEWEGWNPRQAPKGNRTGTEILHSTSRARLTQDILDEIESNTELGRKIKMAEQGEGPLAAAMLRKQQRARDIRIRDLGGSTDIIPEDIENARRNFIDEMVTRGAWSAKSQPVGSAPGIIQRKLQTVPQNFSLPSAATAAGLGINLTPDMQERIMLSQISDWSGQGGRPQEVEEILAGQGRVSLSTPQLQSWMGPNSRTAQAARSFVDNTMAEAERLMTTHEGQIDSNLTRLYNEATVAAGTGDWEATKTSTSKLHAHLKDNFAFMGRSFTEQFTHIENEYDRAFKQAFNDPANIGFDAEERIRRAAVSAQTKVDSMLDESGKVVAEKFAQNEREFDKAKSKLGVSTRYSRQGMGEVVTAGASRSVALAEQVVAAQRNVGRAVAESIDESNAAMQKAAAVENRAAAIVQSGSTGSPSQLIIPGRSAAPPKKIIIPGPGTRKFNAGGIANFLPGGRVSGPGGPTDDVIPAYLSNGEFVIKANSVSRVGLDTLKHINETGTVPNNLVYASTGGSIKELLGKSYKQPKGEVLGKTDLKIFINEILTLGNNIEMDKGELNKLIQDIRKNPPRYRNLPNLFGQQRGHVVGTVAGVQKVAVEDSLAFKTFSAENRIMDMLSGSKLGRLVPSDKPTLYEYLQKEMDSKTFKILNGVLTRNGQALTQKESQAQLKAAEILLGSGKITNPQTRIQLMSMISNLRVETAKTKAAFIRGKVEQLAASNDKVRSDPKLKSKIHQDLRRMESDPLSKKRIEGFAQFGIDHYISTYDMGERARAKAEREALETQREAYLRTRQSEASERKTRIQMGWFPGKSGPRIRFIPSAFKMGGLVGNYAGGGSILSKFNLADWIRRIRRPKGLPSKSDPTRKDFISNNVKNALFRQEYGLRSKPGDRWLIDRYGPKQWEIARDERAKLNMFRDEPYGGMTDRDYINAERYFIERQKQEDIDRFILNRRGNGDIPMGDVDYSLNRPMRGFAFGGKVVGNLRNWIASQRRPKGLPSKSDSNRMNWIKQEVQRALYRKEYELRAKPGDKWLIDRYGPKQWEIARDERAKLSMFRDEPYGGMSSRDYIEAERYYAERQNREDEQRYALRNRRAGENAGLFDNWGYGTGVNRPGGFALGGQVIANLKNWILRQRKPRGLPSRSEGRLDWAREQVKFALHRKEFGLKPRPGDQWLISKFGPKQWEIARDERAKLGMFRDEPYGGMTSRDYIEAERYYMAMQEREDQKRYALQNRRAGENAGLFDNWGYGTGVNRPGKKFALGGQVISNLRNWISRQRRPRGLPSRSSGERMDWINERLQYALHRSQYGLRPRPGDSWLISRYGPKPWQRMLEERRLGRFSDDPPMTDREIKMLKDSHRQYLMQKEAEERRLRRSNNGDIPMGDVDYSLNRPMRGFANGGMVGRYAFGGWLGRKSIAINSSPDDIFSIFRHGYSTAVAAEQRGLAVRTVSGAKASAQEPEYRTLRGRLEKHLFDIPEGTEGNSRRPVYAYLNDQDAPSTGHYGRMQYHIDDEWLRQNNIKLTTTPNDSLDQFVMGGFERRKREEYGLEDLSPNHEAVKKFTASDTSNLYREVQIHTPHIPPEAIKGATYRMNNHPVDSLTLDTGLDNLNDYDFEDAIEKNVKIQLTKALEAMELKQKLADTGKTFEIKIYSRAKSKNMGIDDTDGEWITADDFATAKAAILTDARALMERRNLNAERFSMDSKRDIEINQQSLFPGSIVDRERERLGYPALERRFQTGGSVFGPGGPTDDVIPAYLSNGEYVINAKAHKRVGTKVLDAINGGKVKQAYAMGGPVKFSTGGGVEDFGMGLHPIPYDSGRDYIDADPNDPRWGTGWKPEVVTEFNRNAGSSTIIDMDERKIVMVEVGGKKVPFYLSTGHGGKKDVPPGKWYPFFGVGQEGWINKTNGKDMVNYYDSPELREISEELDKRIGDVRERTDIPKVYSGRGKEKDLTHRNFINSDLPNTPATDFQVTDLERENMRKNIDWVKELAKTGPWKFRKAEGGAIYGPGTSKSDSIPAMLSNGEYVISAKGHKSVGTGLLDAINSGKTAMGFHGGGSPGGSQPGMGGMGGMKGMAIGMGATAAGGYAMTSENQVVSGLGNTAMMAGTAAMIHPYAGLAVAVAGVAKTFYDIQQANINAANQIVLNYGMAFDKLTEMEQMMVGVDLKTLADVDFAKIAEEAGSSTQALQEFTNAIANATAGTVEYARKQIFAEAETPEELLADPRFKSYLMDLQTAAYIKGGDPAQIQNSIKQGLITYLTATGNANWADEIFQKAVNALPQTPDISKNLVESLLKNDVESRKKMNDFINANMTNSQGAVDLKSAQEMIQEFSNTETNFQNTLGAGNYLAVGEQGKIRSIADLFRDSGALYNILLLAKGEGQKQELNIGGRVLSENNKEDVEWARNLIDNLQETLKKDPINWLDPKTPSASNLDVTLKYYFKENFGNTLSDVEKSKEFTGILGLSDKLKKNMEELFATADSLSNTEYKDFLDTLTSDVLMEIPENARVAKDALLGLRDQFVEGGDKAKNFDAVLKGLDGDSVSRAFGGAGGGQLLNPAIASVDNLRRAALAARVGFLELGYTMDGLNDQQFDIIINRIIRTQELRISQAMELGPQISNLEQGVAAVHETGLTADQAYGSTGGGGGGGGGASFNSKPYDDAIKAQQGLIDKINEEREARQKLADAQRANDEYMRSEWAIRKKIAEAQGTGDFLAADLAQRELNSLREQKAKDDVERLKRDQEDKRIKAAEKEIERLQEKLDAAQRAFDSGSSGSGGGGGAAANKNKTPPIPEEITAADIEALGRAGVAQEVVNNAAKTLEDIKKNPAVRKAYNYAVAAVGKEAADELFTTFINQSRENLFNNVPEFADAFNEWSETLSDDPTFQAWPDNVKALIENQFNDIIINPDLQGPENEKARNQAIRKLAKQWELKEETIIELQKSWGKFGPAIQEALTSGMDSSKFSEIFYNNLREKLGTEIPAWGELTAEQKSAMSGLLTTIAAGGDVSPETISTLAAKLIPFSEPGPSGGISADAAQRNAPKISEAQKNFSKTLTDMVGPATLAAKQASEKSPVDFTSTIKRIAVARGTVVFDAQGNAEFQPTGGEPATVELPDPATVNKAYGGYISGPGGPRDDLIPARLSDGEYVIQANAVDYYGKGFLDKVNQKQYGGESLFANGGRVGWKSGMVDSSITRYAPPGQPVPNVRADSDGGTGGGGTGGRLGMGINTGAGLMQWAAATFTGKGIPYSKTANNTKDGFGCSGFVEEVLRKVNLSAGGAYSPTQMNSTSPISGNPWPGDLLFWQFPSNQAWLKRAPGEPNHVGFYYGGNMMLHSSGGHGPNLSSLSGDYDMNGNDKFLGAHRVLPDSMMKAIMDNFKTSGRQEDTARLSRYKIDKFHNGGAIGYSKGGEVMAMVQGGEVVVPINTVDKVNPLLDALTSGKIGLGEINNNITINGANHSPKVIAEMVVKEIDKSMKRTINVTRSI